MTVAPSFARRSSDGVKKAELLSLRKCEIASHRNWSAIMKMMFGGALVDGGGDGFAFYRSVSFVYPFRPPFVCYAWFEHIGVIWHRVIGPVCG